MRHAKGLFLASVALNCLFILTEFIFLPAYKELTQTEELNLLAEIKYISTFNRSFDVTALFTSVPIDETLDVIASRLQNDTTLAQLIQEDGSLQIRIYRKPTHTDQYLNFDSNHPLDHKLGVVRTLFHRANTIVSDPQDLETEKSHLTQALKTCGYPQWAINKATCPKPPNTKPSAGTKSKGITAPRWVYNKTAADKFRSKLEACCNGSHNLLVTRSNTPVNTIIQYDGERTTKLDVTTEIWIKFPQKTPFRYKKYATCSVVGNSGLLKGSGCGKEIDSAEFVFRMCQSISFAVQTTLQEYNSSLPVVFGNPTFMLAMNEYWKSNGVKAERISTGLFLASAALSICAEVHLYGFWPFHVDKHTAMLTEHYYDDRRPHKIHKLPDEFVKLQQLHREGILQLRTDSCS
ncbi:hypothetical protein Bbelb_028580 [Branchiostoma belcheri]|nr:hypothetical protein Bbelb_028580 [Branchiostoma belcheri]